MGNYSPEVARELLSQDADWEGNVECDTPEDIWNSWVGANYTPEQAVAEARERGMTLRDMAEELVICAAEAHGVALTDTHDPDALAAVFLGALERAELELAHRADDARPAALADAGAAGPTPGVEPDELPF